MVSVQYCNSHRVNGITEKRSLQVRKRVDGTKRRPVGGVQKE